jgi:hypothetical protein
MTTALGLCGFSFAAGWITAAWCWNYLRPRDPE